MDIVEQLRADAEAVEERWKRLAKLESEAHRREKAYRRYMRPIRMDLVVGGLCAAAVSAVCLYLGLFEAFVVLAIIGAIPLLWDHWRLVDARRNRRLSLRARAQFDKEIRHGG